jgi:hypothetical protein
VRAGAARVHHALGDPLAVEVRDLLEEVVVLEHRRAAVAHGAVVLVVDDRVALARGQDGGLVLPVAVAVAVLVRHARSSWGGP